MHKLLWNNGLHKNEWSAKIKQYYYQSRLKQVTNLFTALSTLFTYFAKMSTSTANNNSIGSTLTHQMSITCQAPPLSQRPRPDLGNQLKVM